MLVANLSRFKSTLRFSALQMLKEVLKVKSYPTFYSWEWCALLERYLQVFTDYIFQVITTRIPKNL